MDNKTLSTHDEECPVFEKWSSWYILVLVVNVLLVAIIYLIFNAI